MNISVGDVYDAVNTLAPFCEQAGFDNAGLLAGNREMPVTRMLFSLDITPEVVREAAEIGADLIVAHHPVIFQPLKRVLPQDEIWQLARAGIAAICAHTNYDVAEHGVSEILWKKIGNPSRACVPVRGEDGHAYVRMGNTEPCSLDGFALHVKQVLGCPAVRVLDAGRPVCRVAVCGGAGGCEVETVVDAGADTYVTGELKYHEILLARKRGLNVVEAGHFETENPAVFALCDTLAEKFPGTVCSVSAVHRDFLKIF